jgi:hypothetical protein
VRERPILFSGPMVRALLDGRKTQTRRVIRLPADRGQWESSDLQGHAVIWNTTTGKVISCPHGAPGDRLWVRETWCQEVDRDGRLIEGKALYAADGQEVFLSDGDGGTAWRPDGRARSPWRSPLFMPRWASRITLELTAVRVERLQDISEADAVAEAAPCKMVTNLYPEQCGCFLAEDEPTHHFALLWDSLNAKRAPWASNPWVWVLEFRRVTP